VGCFLILEKNIKNGRIKVVKSEKLAPIGELLTTPSLILTSLRSVKIRATRSNVHWTFFTSKGGDDNHTVLFFDVLRQ